jgi:hypothetical protein
MVMIKISSIRKLSRGGKNLLIAFVLCVSMMLLAIACENGTPRDNACEPCLSAAPDSGDLIINFSINSQHIKVPFTVFRGDFEDGKVVLHDTAFVNEVSLFLSSDQYYSVVAEYQQQGTSTRVVDGAKIKKRKRQCPDPDNAESTISCWYAEPGKINATIIENSSKPNQ